MSAIEPTSSLRDLEDKLDRIIELLEQLVEQKQTGSTVTQFVCGKCHSLSWRVNEFGLCDACVRMAGGAL